MMALIATTHMLGYLQLIKLSYGISKETKFEHIKGYGEYTTISFSKCLFTTSFQLPIDLKEIEMKFNRLILLKIYVVEKLLVIESNG